MSKNHLSWRQFEAGRDYNRRVGLYENTACNERFYRGDQWHSVNSGMLPTPIFNFVRRITDYLVSQVAVTNVDIVYSDENLPFVTEEDGLRQKLSAAISLLNRNAAFRWEKCRLDRLIRQSLLDAAISGDGVFFTFWDPTIVTGQDYTGDFVTTTIDGANVFFSDVNSTDLQSQEYIIVSGRESVNRLRAEALNAGITASIVDSIVSDSDVRHGVGDCASIEGGDVDGGKATYIIKFFKNSEGYICFEKSVKQCVIRTVTTKLRLYPIAMYNWIPTKNSYHGTSPLTAIIGNQKYINKAYALLMKHMIDTAFSKVVYDKTRIPEWSNEVGESIGVIGGDLEGVASTIKPGEMDNSFIEVIKSVIYDTKEAMGATEASLGESNPTNTSAILALQESNSVTLDSIRTQLFSALEDLAAIWVDFMCAYYADGRMIIIEDEDGPHSTEIDCRLLRGELIRARVDVGSSNRYSKSSAMSLLASLLENGHITLKQYLERLPDGVFPGREQLIEEITKLQEESHE